ncbi:MAG: SusC/RagA family TonB-linked outer membrane protein [Gemmatimonas sp.]
MSRWTRRIAAAVACIVGAQEASAQAVGVISGRVTDLASGQPVGAVNVTIVGSTNGALTGEDGRYIIRQVPAGSVTLNFARIGYESNRTTVTVSGTAPVVADVTLKTAVLSLQTFVTTVTGPTRKIELGTTTSQIAVAEKIRELPVNSMGTLLSGRAAGVQVASSGASGTGSRIRIRGQSSLTLANDPIIFIDGVRIISNTAQGNSGPSRFDDLSPSEIENIEVIKGPSAATLYGTDAANGVIAITTKKGKSGRTTWSVYTENGVIQDPNKGSYPNQYYNWGTVVTRNSAGAITNTQLNQQCRLTLIASNLCIKSDSVTSRNNLNDPLTTPLANGHRNAYGLQVSGGSDRVQFFVSGDLQGEVGIYRMPDMEVERLKRARGVSDLPDWQKRPNYLDRVNLRANLTAQLAQSFNVQVSSSFISSTQNLPPNEDNSTGLMVNAIAGNSARTDNRQIQTVNGVTDTIRLYGQFSSPMGDILSVRNRQDVNRFINSLQGRWQATSWLSARGTVGLDMTEILGLSGNFLDQGPFGTGRIGSLNNGRTLTTQTSLDFGATATNNITSGIQSKFSAGVQYVRNLSRNTSASGNTLPPGAVTLSGAANRSGSESTSEFVTMGTYLEEQLSFGDRLFLTGGIRFDDNSAFGAGFNGARYPKVSASYAISEEPWFPRPNFLDNVRLRSAYGASGNAPGLNAANRFYTSSNYTTTGGAIVTGIVLDQLGNSDLRPEYSGEYEGGFDLGLFDGATNFEVTYFSKLSKDALINRQISPSIGFATQTANIGSVKNAGVEFVLNQRVIDRQNFAFNFNVTGSSTRNKLVTLGEGVTPIFTGNRNTQRNTYGYPLFGMWGRTYTINDRNGDGIIQAPTVATATVPADPGDLILNPGDTTVYLGNTYPKLEMAVSPTLELFNRKLRINGQFDTRAGFKKLNNTLRHQCSTGSYSCRGINDPTAPLEEQAAAVALNNYPGTILTGFYRDMSFTRFRELSVAYQMPDRLARAVRASRWNIILTGRNLYLWSGGYDGVDPETTVGNSDARGGEEYFSTPPLRTFTFRMNFNF